MARLNVNIDHVATVRQARRADEPDPVWAAVECQLAGAAGITMHLREDRRHIQDRDVQLVRRTTGILLNLEMAMTEAMIRFAIRLKPDQVTLVPERRQELTTEGGLDAARHQQRLARATARLRRAGILVSAFIVPDPAQVEACVKARCDAVELHTGPYANARSDQAVNHALKALERARDKALETGLTVHAGHGLTYRNIAPVAALAGLTDFNIGHSIVARSIFLGIREATRQMLVLIQKHEPSPTT